MRSTMRSTMSLRIRKIPVLLAMAFAAVVASGCAMPASAGLATSLTSVHSGTRAQVPWRSVGPGWALAAYSASTPPGVVPRRAGPTTLYLISPAGARYRLYRWSAREIAPGLVDWSGDKSRALLVRYPSAAGRLRIEQLDLATGKLTELFGLPTSAVVDGYTHPRGLNILVSLGTGQPTRIVRYNLHGQVQATIARGNGIYARQSPDGTTLAVSAADGLTLVSNGDGSLIRRLPVRGSGNGSSCYPDRWWNARTILADCIRNGYGQTWLVPANGTTPGAITPRRNGHGADPSGDINAWLLPSGLYLQAIGACSAVYIVKALPLRVVTIPGTTGNNNQVLTARGSRLLVKAQTGCPGSDSLLWFNPATRAVQMLLRAPNDVAGVLAAVPYGRLNG
jgi:hypothetical protein